MKAYTDVEQSKKLAEILSVDSADHHYVRKTCDFMGNPVDGKWSTPKYGNPESSYANYLVQNFTSYEKIPCWSLAALINILPIIEGYGEEIPHLFKFGDKWMCKYVGDEDYGMWRVADNQVDVCYEMILKLHELKML